MAKRKKYQYYVIERSYPESQEEKFMCVPGSWLTYIIDDTAIIRYPQESTMYSGNIIKKTDNADFANSYAKYCNKIEKVRNDKTFKENEPVSFEQKSHQLKKPIQSPYHKINNETEMQGIIKSMSSQLSLTNSTEENNEKHAMIVETTNFPKGLTNFMCINRSLDQRVVILNNEKILYNDYEKNVDSIKNYDNQLQNQLPEYTPQIMKSPLKMKFCRKSINSVKTVRKSYDRDFGVSQQHLEQKELSPELKKHLTKRVHNISQSSEEEHVVPSSNIKYLEQTNLTPNAIKEDLNHREKKSVEDIDAFENLQSNPVVRKFTLNRDYSVELVKFRKYMNDILEDHKTFEVRDWMTGVHSEMKKFMGKFDYIYSQYKDVSIGSEIEDISSQKITTEKGKGNYYETIQPKTDNFLGQKVKNHIVNRNEEEYDEENVLIIDEDVQDERGEGIIVDQRKSKQPLELKSNKISYMPQKSYSQPLILPRSYDTYDTRWTLKYQNEADGLVELIEGSGVYVSFQGLSNCQQSSKDSKAFARGLLAEVFSEAALTTCSLQGGGKNRRRTATRPGLDSCALKWLLKAVTMQARHYNWEKLKTPQQIKHHRKGILLALRAKVAAMRKLKEKKMEKESNMFV